VRALPLALLAIIGCEGDNMNFGGGHSLNAGRLMSLGDSITQGNHTPSKDGFRKVLHDGLTAAGIAHIEVGGIEGDGNGGGTLVWPYNRHEGYGSNTIAQLTARVPGRMAINPADTVTIHAGTVDCAAGATVAQMVTDLSALIDAVSSSGTRRIVLAQIIPQGPPNGGSPELVQQYNAEMPGLVATKRAAGHRIVLVDMFTGFDIASWSTDGVHPTSEVAAAFMGWRWVDGINRALRVN
jgi:lysophospholipase L1-like esterase